MDRSIQALGATIETTRLASRYACDLTDTRYNRTIVEEAVVRISADIESLSHLRSSNISDLKVKAGVLISCCDGSLEAELNDLAISLALDILFLVT
jgi:hypothetical protein